MGIESSSVGWARLATLALALSPVSSGRVLVVAGRGLFALAVVGIVVGALLPDTADPRTPSVLSRLQNLVTRPGPFLGVLLVSVGLLRVPGWRPAAWILTIGYLLERDLGGIGQRAVFAALYVCVLILAFRILVEDPSETSI